MTKSRPIPLPLTALVAFFSALAALAVSGGMNMAQAHGGTVHSNTAHSNSAHSNSVHAAIPTSSSLTLHDGMRKLWEDHITWTRLAIVDLEDGSPETSATVARLLRNQADIGSAIKPYYGAKAGNELTRELKSHILIAADVIAAAKAGDQAKLHAAQARWVQNADQIAALLHGANPAHWPLATLKAEMHMHLVLTTQEAVAHLQKKWAADIAAYDRVHRHILHMSDLLSAGIVQQFPARFR
jgi:hypothetical protein